MSQPRFLADEDLRNSIVHAVRRMEPDVDITTVVDAGQSSASDAAVLDYAWENQWLLLSHDVNTMRSFAEQRIAHGAGMHGLFLMPHSCPTHSVADSVVLIWSASEFEELPGRSVPWGASMGRAKRQ